MKLGLLPRIEDFPTTLRLCGLNLLVLRDPKSCCRRMLLKGDPFCRGICRDLFKGLAICRRLILGVLLALAPWDVLKKLRSLLGFDSVVITEAVIWRPWEWKRFKKIYI